MLSVWAKEKLIHAQRKLAEITDISDSSGRAYWRGRISAFKDTLEDFLGLKLKETEKG